MHISNAAKFANPVCPVTGGDDGGGGERRTLIEMYTLEDLAPCCTQ